MTEKTLPSAAEAMTLVAEDAAKAPKDERKYSMGTHKKSRQGDVYFMTLKRSELPDSSVEFDTTKKPTKKLEISKSHVLMGSFHVCETSEGTYFIQPSGKDRSFVLKHPEHADHLFDIPEGTTLYFWIQKTMDKDTIGRQVWD